jgi:membrane protein YqaA with SNARE-associated domain
MLPAAVLPIPSEPSLVAFGAAIGAFVGSTVAWTLGYDADNRMRWMLEGSYYGTGFALLLYLIANAHEAGLL